MKMTRQNLDLKALQILANLSELIDTNQSNSSNDYDDDDFDDDKNERDISDEERIELAEYERDTMTRIAYAVMKALEENGQADFVLLQNEEVRSWWIATKAKEEREQREREAKERKERAIIEALAKLTAEEKKLLGL